MRRLQAGSFYPGRREIQASGPAVVSAGSVRLRANRLGFVPFVAEALEMLRP
ncbi:mCG148109 [Mus musculus]|nr:mCG148109 [Mus musculus]